MKRKKCKMCGKMFATKDAKRRYCCKKCRMEAREKLSIERGQLCWSCKHATNATRECSWSRELKPVKGWTAKPVIIKEEDGYTCRTYQILKCPKFIHD